MAGEGGMIKVVVKSVKEKKDFDISETETIKEVRPYDVLREWRISVALLRQIDVTTVSAAWQLVKIAFVDTGISGAHLHFILFSLELG